MLEAELGLRPQRSRCTRRPPTDAGPGFMRVDALVGDNAGRARAWIRDRRAHGDGGARAEDRFDRSARTVRRPRGSVCAGPSAVRGRGVGRGGRDSARSQPRLRPTARSPRWSAGGDGGAALARVRTAADTVGTRARAPKMTLSQRPYRDQPGYSSLRQARFSSGSAFGVRSSRNEWYGATNGSGAITV
jgi:hypothetical protein